MTGLITLPQRLLPLLLPLISLLLPGCITADAALTLNPDGSGKIVITEILTNKGRQNIGEMTQNGKIPDIDITGYFRNIDKSQLTAQALNYSEGLSFTSAKPLSLPDGSMGKIITYSFKDINQLKLYTGKSKDLPTVTFHFSENELTISVKLSQKDRTELTRTTSVLGNLLPAYAEAFNGMKVSIIFILPAPVSQTNAHFLSHEKNLLTILNIDVGKLIATPAAINTLIEFPSNTPEELAAKLQPYNEWLKLETADRITLILQQNGSEQKE